MTYMFTPVIILPVVAVRPTKCAEATQLISPATIGIALRYGIFIHNDFSDDRYTIVHELVHTMQCERFGGFYHFLKEYLWECIGIGYPEAPLEQEAVRIADRICGITLNWNLNLLSEKLREAG